jgi:N-carbamoyl-L-amino-acid hydrolase
LELTVDIRHPQQQAYDAMLAGYEKAVSEACTTLDLPFDMHCFWLAPGIEFNGDCVDAVRSATQSRDYSFREIVSGAGHDACNLSSVVPTSMIFIPCADGLSHNEAEYAEPEHLTKGANILLDAMLTLADQ